MRDPKIKLNPYMITKDDGTRYDTPPGFVSLPDYEKHIMTILRSGV